MRPSRAASGGEPQTPEQMMVAFQAFLADHPKTVLVEDGKVLFDLTRARYSLDAAHGRCTLHLWDEERNLVRTVTAASLRPSGLRLTTQRFGQGRSSTLELLADREQRTPAGPDQRRRQYARVLERVLARGAAGWGEWSADGFRTAMDLERSFGPAYTRGSLVRGQDAWALIGVNAAETPATIDGILTVGVLWLHHCRENAAGRRLYRGLRIIVPRGAGALSASRLAWMNTQAAQWELWELDERTEELEQRDAADHGNLTTHLVYAPDEAAAGERFRVSLNRVLALVPADEQDRVEVRLRSSAEAALLLHGLEFARVRTGYAGQSFNRVDEITIGAGANETPLSEDNAAEMRARIATLFQHRKGAVNDGSGVGANRMRRKPNSAGAGDPLYRMQPERWLESVLRRETAALDQRLDPAHVYTQVPAFAASDRGILDLLGVERDGRLAVIELKADEDLHLVFQGLDYWVRVRWHHLGPGHDSEFQRYGYFPGVRLLRESPRLYLVAPALRVHPACEVVLRYLSPEVPWELIALDERWRERVRVVWRKHGGANAR